MELVYEHNVRSYSGSKGLPAISTLWLTHALHERRRRRGLLIALKIDRLGRGFVQSEGSGGLGDDLGPVNGILFSSQRVLSLS